MLRTTWFLPAVALVLAASLVQPAAGDILSDIGAIPNPFSPNADGVFDSTAVHYTVEAPRESVLVVVRIASSVEPEGEFWTLAEGDRGSGDYSHWWNGTAADAVPLEDGEYYFAVTAFPTAGPTERFVTPITLDTEPPGIVSLQVVPSRFSPDGDGVGDSLFVSFSVTSVGPADQVSVSVTDEDDETVRELLSGFGVDTVAIFWDGRFDDESLGPDGLYHVQIKTRDAAGNSAEASVLVDLDTAPPLLGVDYSPDPEVEEVRVDVTTAAVTGWAFDRAGVVALEISTDGETWDPITFAGADTVYWEADVACTACIPIPEMPDETLTVFVRGRDGTPTAGGGGHVNTETSSVPILEFVTVFDVAGPIHDTTEIDDDNAIYFPGETITISTLWDEDRYVVEADFSQIDSAFEPEDVEVTDHETGLYRIRYVLSTENTFVPVEGEPVTITVTDLFERPGSAPAQIVSVLPGAGGPTGLSVGRNAFNPADGEDVTIGLGSDGGTIDVYNVAGTLVTTLRTSDGSSLIWDGRNADGDLVASGVYYLWIQTDEGDAVRKVAVVK